MYTVLKAYRFFKQDKSELDLLFWGCDSSKYTQGHFGAKITNYVILYIPVNWNYEEWCQ